MAELEEKGDSSSLQRWLPSEQCSPAPTRSTSVASPSHRDHEELLYRSFRRLPHCLGANHGFLLLIRGGLPGERTAIVRAGEGRAEAGEGEARDTLRRHLHSPMHILGPPPTGTGLLCLRETRVPCRTAERS